MKQLILLISIGFLAGCYGTDPVKTGKEGKPMPEFSLLLPDSTRLYSKDIPTGKPVVLMYYSPYCPYCKAQTEAITDNMDNLKNIRFYFISGFPLPDIKKFSQDHQLSKYTNITTGVDTTRVLTDYFEITGFPYLAIYGKDKTLNESFLGKIYSSQIKKAAEK